MKNHENFINFNGYVICSCGTNNNVILIKLTGKDIIDSYIALVVTNVLNYHLKSCYQNCV